MYRKTVGEKLGAPASKVTIGSDPSAGNSACDVFNFFSGDERSVERYLRRHALPQFRAPFVFERPILFAVTFYISGFSLAKELRNRGEPGFRWLQKKIQ